jgi:FkbM family methyltransferase
MKINISRAVKKVTKKAINRFSGNGILNYKNQGKINLIDVGSLGNLPEPWLSNSNYISRLLSFEPLESAKKNKNIIISTNALWSENCVKPFYIYKGFKSSGSSLFEQNFEYVNDNYDTLKEIGPKYLAETWHERSSLIKVLDIECKTLDNTIRDLNLPSTFDFLKIDAQGAEYEILKGAMNFLKSSCIGLQLELFNIPLYKGIKLLPEVVVFLSAQGFELVKKLEYHGSFNSQNDCIFLRRDIPEERKEIVQLLTQLYQI